MTPRRFRCSAMVEDMVAAVAGRFARRVPVATRPGISLQCLPELRPANVRMGRLIEAVPLECAGWRCTGGHFNNHRSAFAGAARRRPCSRRTLQVIDVARRDDVRGGHATAPRRLSGAEDDHFSGLRLCFSIPQFRIHRPVNCASRRLRLAKHFPTTPGNAAERSSWRPWLVLCGPRFSDLGRQRARHADR